MEKQAFLNGIPDLVRSHLSADLRQSRHEVKAWGLVKISYGNRLIHYELHSRPRLSVIEIGLHFEADELTNARLLGAFRTHARAIARELPGARFEEWDREWTRVWEPVPCEALDAGVQRDIAARLAHYITTLEPILREELPADVAWDLTRTRSSDRQKRAPAAPSASARRASAPRARGRAPSARSPRPRRGGSRARRPAR